MVEKRGEMYRICVNVCDGEKIRVNLNGGGEI